MFARGALICLVFSMLSASLYGQTCQPYERGKVYDSIAVGLQQTYYYSLYIPKKGPSDRPLPLILIFDPLARSGLAIRKFQKAAEAHSCILVCSDDSRNGLHYKTYEEIYENIVSFLEIKGLVHRDQIIPAGFSGGARVAAYLGIVHNSSSILACGAGLNTMELPPGAMTGSHYLGITGILDMNYQEAMRVDQHLASRRIPHMLITPETGHEWPSDSLLNLAIGWMIGQSYSRTSAAGSNTEEFQSIVDYYQGEITNCLQRNDPVTALRYLGYCIELSVSRSRHFKILHDSLEQSEGYKEALKVAERIKEEEIRQQLFIDEQFSRLTLLQTSGDTAAREISGKIAKYYAMTHRKDLRQAEMAYRLLGLVNHNAMVIGFELYRNGYYVQSMQLFDIWKKASPQNSWAYFHHARAAAISNHRQAAYRSMRKACDYGLSSPELFLTDPAFTVLHKSKKFLKLQHTCIVE